MRVDQIITFVWIGNVLLLGGTGWVGWTFWQQKKSPPPAKTVEWPEVAMQPTPARWPGDQSKFKHIWETPLNGLVPPPPKPAETVTPVKVDPATAFRARYTIEAGFFSSTSLFTTMLQVKDTQSGRSIQIVPGDSLDDWKLVKVDLNLEKGACRATFSNPAYAKDDGTLTVEQVLAQVAPVGKPGEPTPFVKEYPAGGTVHREVVPREKFAPQAYKDVATGEWNVPATEIEWLSAWGEEEILSKTKFVERPEGLEIASRPPRAALDSTREIDQGDVVVSINGTPVKTLADVTGYLRGAGRGLPRYEVVIERDGLRRTQVFNVQRTRGPATRSQATIR